jgi:signal transduction histidine kinase
VEDRTALHRVHAWQIAVIVLAVVVAAAAVWLTSRADFLRYPGWLAAQKADFILGPILAGVYWYGFLFALVAAELFAARAVERLVGQSLRHPTIGELETMLREPLGDPDFKLVFAGAARGEPAAIPSEPGRAVKLVAHEGVPPVAILHDPQLDDGPELLEAAGAVALLATQNAELEAGWTDALHELERSRARLARAADDERRRLERNLHDTAQQRLVAIRIRLDMAADRAEDEDTSARIRELAGSVDAVLEEVREVAHGLYPPLLTSEGLRPALRRLCSEAAVPMELHAEGVGATPRRSSRPSTPAARRRSRTRRRTADPTFTSH